MHRRRSRKGRYAIAITTVLAVLALFATAAVAADFNSGSKITSTGDHNLHWTGNGGGASFTQACGDAASGHGVPTDGTDYLLWIFTTDGGSAVATPNVTPQLHLGGSGSGTYDYTFANGSGTASTFQFVTPFFEPDSNLTAYVSFTTNDTGNGVWILTISHGCPAEVEFDATMATEVHDPDHNDVTNGSVDLGTEIHDLATVTEVTGTVASGTVSFTLYEGLECDPGEEDANVIDTENVALGTDKTGDEPSFPNPLQATSTPQALGAGDYSFGVTASLTSTTNQTINIAADECEPFTVDKADTTVVTEVHDADHNDITGGTVHVGDYVHDKGIIDTGLVTGFDPDGDMRFEFFTNGTCYGTASSSEDVTVANDGTAETTAMQILAPGSYSYQAKYLGDDNYNESDFGECEPFTAVPRAFGKTMGFWGNVNGQALLAANNAFTVNPVTLGIVNTRCWVTVDSASKSKTILPSTLNGMSILTNCTTTASLDSGINGASMNTLLSQTLALSYNIKFVTNYAGQTIQGLGCTAVSPLTSAFNGNPALGPTSTVEQVRDYSNSLIGHAIKNNGSLTVTQGQIGAMNTLLGCLNREA
jgi:hypothetical protein